ncbi:CLUMA_CG018208, isoform A [Clunio marinus]|uniref:CLUMA_CG018208, isoform A n=1 Tax=Clunio marinus TaxID=568069 RepID=A0A1J1IZ95_9DIPT|nr:CLUMA_CG018208, isoform A [Clunio marinus]
MERSSIDVKSCLLRMICEAQNFLLPPGYSMFQDMLRIVFTVPIRDDLKDDYSNAMREAKDQDCFKVYSERCPISILAFLLYSKH